MRVLEAREIGHGILVEHDGYLSPDDNKGILKARGNVFDFATFLVEYGIDFRGIISLLVKLALVMTC